MVGLGTGFGYVTPIATLVKWFPDKRGMMVGLAVMGIGISPLVFGVLIERLIGTDRERSSPRPSRHVYRDRGHLRVGVVGAAQFCARRRRAGVRRDGSPARPRPQGARALTPAACWAPGSSTRCG